MNQHKVIQVEEVAILVGRDSCKGAQFCILFVNNPQVYQVLVLAKPRVHLGCMAGSHAAIHAWRTAMQPYREPDRDEQGTTAFAVL